MTNDELLNKAKEIVVNYVNTHEPSIRFNVGVPCAVSEVNIAWYCKTFQHWKAIATVTKFPDEIFEIVYNGNNDTAYVRVYEVSYHIDIPMSESMEVK